MGKITSEVGAFSKAEGRSLLLDTRKLVSFFFGGRLTQVGLSDARLPADCWTVAGLVRKERRKAS